jgi:GAF domain-containing protein
MEHRPDTPLPVSGLTSALAELVDLMLATSTVEQLLDDIAQLAGAITTPHAAVGITVRRNGRAYTVATNGQLAANLDEIQYGKGEGPCLRALRTGEVIMVDDLSSETRFGEYRTLALGYGVRSSLSLPLVVEGKVRGALNLYSLNPAAFGLAERTAAELFATQAAAAFTLVTRQAHQMQMSTQLRDALASRAVIDQAIGIIMNQRRISAERAFEILRETSQHQNRKLRDVAVAIVTAIGGEPPRPATFHEPG